jgi:hypothetical protein
MQAAGREAVTCRSPPSSAQRITLESIAPMSDDPLVSPPDAAA